MLTRGARARPVERALPLMLAAGEVFVAGRKHLAPGGAAGYATAHGMLVLLVTPALEGTL